MEINSFLFGTGVALFLALLAWGDMIRKPRNSVSELEKSYIEQLKEKGKTKQQILPIIRPPSEYSFSEQMSSLIDLWDNKVKGKELQLRTDFKKLYVQKKNIEGFYSFRYYAVIIFTVVCFAMGILSSVLGSVDLFKGISLDVVSIGIFLFVIHIILANLIIAYQMENKFVKDLYKTFDKLEV